MRQCCKCGGAGHLARECWHPQVRNISSAESTQVPTGSPTSSVSVNSSVSQNQHGAQQQPTVPATQMRVPRICENSEVNEDVNG